MPEYIFMWQFYLIWLSDKVLLIFYPALIDQSFYMFVIALDQPLWPLRIADEGSDIHWSL